MPDVRQRKLRQFCVGVLFRNIRGFDTFLNQLKTVPGRNEGLCCINDIASPVQVGSTPRGALAPILVCAFQVPSDESR